jgi:hypothetical protein
MSVRDALCWGVSAAAADTVTREATLDGWHRHGGYLKCRTGGWSTATHAAGTTTCNHPVQARPTRADALALSAWNLCNADGGASEWHKYHTFRKIAVRPVRPMARWSRKLKNGVYRTGQIRGFPHMSYRPKEPMTASSRWARFFPKEKPPAFNIAAVTDRIDSAARSRRVLHGAGSWPDMSHSVKLARKNEI